MSQIIIIGGGPAGYVCALRLAQYQHQVTLIEENYIGGTCLNNGCIPTKAMLHAGQVYQEILNSGSIGINAEHVSFNFEKILEYRDNTVAKLRNGVIALLKTRGVTTINGKAKLVSDSQVEVNNQIYKADKIILAVGSIPAMPNIDGIEYAVDSDYLVKNKNNLPASIIIVGGGVIGVEYATMLNRLGVDVTIIEFMDRLLPMTDRDISLSLALTLKRSGVKVITNAKVTKIDKSDNKYSVTYLNNEISLVMETSLVLVCVGRKANTSDIGLNAAGINTTKGNIDIDDNHQTNIKNIYAIGDCTGKVQLAHYASAQAQKLAAYLSNVQNHINTNVVPSCVYTNPEIAWAGLSQQQCIEQGIETEVGKFPMAACAKAVIEDNEKGFVKVIFNKETNQIVGAFLHCARATDIIGELSIAIANKMTRQQFEATIHPHPTFVESVSEAVDISCGFPLHVR